MFNFNVLGGFMTSYLISCVQLQLANLLSVLDSNFRVLPLSIA